MVGFGCLKELWEATLSPMVCSEVFFGDGVASYNAIYRNTAANRTNRPRIIARA